MNAPLRRPWTQEEFFAWDGHQEGRYEFDGLAPVAMNGGTINHSIVIRNLHRALDRRLYGGRCQPLGPDAGLQTIGNAVRYPDALVTCSKLAGNALLVPGVVATFEVLSPNSGRLDRITKLREYAAVPSIRHYVILEYLSADVTVLSRGEANEPWIATTLTSDETLHLPAIDIEITVGEFYEGVTFDDSPDAEVG
jgi:Uma2 family endonuclease